MSIAAVEDCSCTFEQDLLALIDCWIPPFLAALLVDASVEYNLEGASEVVAERREHI